MRKLTIQPYDSSIELQDNNTQSLLEILSNHGYLIESVCGGRGTCKKCLVELIDGQLFDKTGNHIEPRFGNKYLACMSHMHGDCVIKIEVVVAAAKATMGLKKALSGKHLPKEVGLAVDVGSTTIAAMLVNLSSFDIIAVETETNPQRAYGADVISRIEFANKEYEGRNGTQILHEMTISAINNLVEKLCHQVCGPHTVLSEEIEKVCVCGNTTMMHLFWNIIPKHLSHAPYSSEFTGSRSGTAESLGLNLRKNVPVMSLPIIASFVGADTVSAVMASNQDLLPTLSLMLDLGTNAEIVLGNKEHLLATSTSAGPAFEGAKLKHGMRAVPGAISSVLLQKDTSLKIETVGGTPAVGICGSGMIDALAALRRLGVINTKGKLLTGSEYVLVRASESGSGQDITVTQQDIREIQLVKGSISAGITVLLNKYGVDPDAVKDIYIAGAFGNFIDLENARYLGLLPQLPIERFHQIGNGAGYGVAMTLSGGDKMIARADAVVAKTEHVELGSLKEFQDIFIASLDFERDNNQK